MLNEQLGLPRLRATPLPSPQGEMVWGSWLGSGNVAPLSLFPWWYI